MNTPSWSRRLGASIAVATLAMSLGGAARADILIGQTAGFTGQVAASVKELTLGAKLYIDKVNAGQVLSELTADGLSIVDVTTRDPDLEDVFLSLVSANQGAE